MALIDTHIWAWILADHPMLTPAIKANIIGEDAHCISPVSLYEICQKERLGKWPMMTPFVGNLPMYVGRSGISILTVDAEIARLAGALDWAHRDPFDRLIAATALVNGLQLISADTAFDSLIGLRRLW